MQKYFLWEAWIKLSLAHIQELPYFSFREFQNQLILFNFMWLLTFLFASLQLEDIIYYFHINTIVMKEMPSWKSRNTFAMKPGKF